MSERFDIGNEGLPEGLCHLLARPDLVGSRDRFLSDCVEEGIRPWPLSVYVLDDFSFPGLEFMMQGVSHYRGIYFHSSSPFMGWIQADSLSMYLDSIGLGRSSHGIVLSYQHLTYRTLLHEGIHAVLHNLPREDVHKIIDSASEVRGSEFLSMVFVAQMQPFELSFTTEDEEIRTLRVLHNVHGNRLFTGELNPRLHERVCELMTTLLCHPVYTSFANLEDKSKANLMDEYVARYLCQAKTGIHGLPPSMPEPIALTLRGIGYKV